MKALSRLQKTVLVQDARSAFAHAAAKARSRGEEFDDSPAAFEAWRHAQVFAAVAKPGLRACRNGHFNLLKSHFEALRGREDRAFVHLLAQGTERRRQLEVSLLRCIEAGGLTPSYAESISRARFGCAVTATTDKQMLQLLMTVKERIRTKRRQRQEPAEAVS